MKILILKNRLSSWILYLTVFSILLFAASIASIFVGSADISFAGAFEALMSNNTGIEREIILNLRLPRILLAIAVGGALSISGVLLQSMFRNPLVEPYTLGISGGAGLGVCLCIIFKVSGILGIILYPAGGFLGAGLVMALVYMLSVKSGVLKIQSMLLNGVMVSFIASSLMMLMMAISRVEELHGIIFWIMGSLDQPSWPLIITALVVSLGGLVVSHNFCLILNAFALGEKEAFHLGFNTERAKKQIFLISSVLAGVSVSAAGIIGFIGLVVPHFVRMVVGSDHRILLVSSYLCGAVFLIICDMMARSIIAPLELPVGVITGVIGGGLFIYAMAKKG